MIFWREFSCATGYSIVVQTQNSGTQEKRSLGTERLSIKAERERERVREKESR